MRRYRVTYSTSFEVNANNEEDAIKLAGEQFNNNVITSYGIEFDYFDIDVDDITLGDNICEEERIEEKEEEELKNKQHLFKELLFRALDDCEDNINKLNNYYIMTYIYDYIRFNYVKLYDIRITKNVSLMAVIGVIIEYASKNYELDLSRSAIHSLLEETYEINEIEKIIREID